MVSIKKKVTLKQKVAEPAQAPAPAPVNPQNPSKGGKKWGIALLVIAAAVVAFFLLKPTKETTDILAEDTVEVPEVVTNQEETATPETVAPETVTSETVTPEVVAQETATPQKETASEVPAEEVKTQTETVANEVKTETVAETPAVKPTTQTVTTTVPVKETELSQATVEQKAISVIRGDFGNGQERKDKLGTEYSVIQKKVNEMYANGLVD